MTAAVTQLAPPTVRWEPGAVRPLSHSGGGTTFLDGLRGLAALYVVLCHAGGLLYTRHAAPGEASFHAPARWVAAVNGALLAPFWRGDFAVLFFFVLSGFVIHLRHAKGLAASADGFQFDLGRYAWRRVKRLYPPLLFALAMTLALDAIGGRLGYAIYSGGTPYPYLNYVVSQDHSARVVAGNAAFLMGMGVGVPCLGSDGPLWSLAYEWWFYAAYPLLWPLLRRGAGGATAVVVALYAATFVPHLWADVAAVTVARKVLMLLPAWWAGALVAEVYVGRWRVGFGRLAPLGVLFGAGFIVPRFLSASDASHAVVQNVMSVGVAGVLCGLFWAQQRRWSLRPLVRLRWLGEMSYTLYVVHAPILIFVSGWYMARWPGEPHLPHTLGPMVVAVPAVLAMAWVLHLGLERPFTGRWRRAAVEREADNSRSVNSIASAEERR